MGKKINLRFVFFILCFYILIFQNLLQSYIEIFKYADEIFALLAVPIFFISSYSTKNRKKNIYENKKIIILLLILLIDGLVSSIMSNLQPANIVLSDMLIVYKFFLVCFLAKFMWNDEFIEKYSRKISIHIKIVILIFVGLTILNYVFNLYPCEYRFGILANRLFYTHPTYLAGVCVFIYAMYICTNKKIFDLYCLSIIVILFSTLRFKSLCAVGAILFLIYIINRQNKKLSFSKLIVIGLLIYIIGYNQISVYFFSSNTDTARYQLTSKSVEIAKDYFPIGTGFATFGSYYSGVNYSPVYYMYNISKVYGIQPNFYSYVADTFWPMVLGQFGIIGTVVYIWIIYEIFRKIQSIYTIENKYIYMAKIVCLFYLIISSFAESAFASSIAIPLALIIGIDFRKKGNES